MMGKTLQKSLKPLTAELSFWMQKLEGLAGLQGSLKVFVTYLFLKKPLDTENRVFVSGDPDSCQPQVFGLLPLSAASLLICSRYSAHYLKPLFAFKMRKKASPTLLFCTTNWLTLDVTASLIFCRYNDYIFPANTLNINWTPATS